MTTAHLSVAGLRFLEWYEMGVTDPKDLVWCAEFYHGQRGWTPNMAMASMTAARRYKQTRNKKDDTGKSNR